MTAEAWSDGGRHSDEVSWQVYENSVQQYRVLSLTTQGLLLTAGAILFDRATHGSNAVDLVPFLAIAIAAMAATWLIFYPVIGARTCIVDFYKFRLHLNYDERGSLRTETNGAATPLTYQQYAQWNKQGKALRAAVAVAGGPSVRRETRRKLDVQLPGIVSSVWLVLAIVAVVTQLG